MLLFFFFVKVLGLFSKVVGAQPQGTLLGWFGSAGSLARIVFPVIAGEFFFRHDVRLSFTLVNSR